jgi:hypothetical protein
MIKIGEKLLVAVKVTSIIETESGICYEVSPLGKDRYYQSMKVIAEDIQSCLGQEQEGGKKK